MRVYGPYTWRSGRNSGRQYVKIIYPDGRRTTMLYSKYKMQELNGWTLTKSQHVHHVDHDRTNDEITNLAIVPASLHSRSHATGKPSPTKGTIKGWTHGSWYAWMKKKCTCRLCVQARKRYNDAQREQRTERGRIYQKPTHGTNSMYRKGCRKECCREAHATAVRLYRQQRAGLA